MMLGRAAPTLHPVAPTFGAILGARQPPPAAVDNYRGLQARPTFCNDVLSCCTRAAWANVLRIWTAGAWGDELITPDAQIEADFFALTGGANIGLDENDVLQRWAHRGAPFPMRQFTDAITGWAALAIHDPDELRTAIYLNRAITVGFNLPATAMAQSRQGATWDVVDASLSGDSAPGSAGGHEVAIGKYDAAAGMWWALTWSLSGDGIYQPITERFRAAYMDQADAPISRTELLCSGLTEAGLDLSALYARFAPAE